MIAPLVARPSARVLARLVALLFAIVLPAVPRVAGAQETPAPAAAAPAEAAPANDASNHGYRGPQPDREVVVLTTFLTSPAYVTKLKEAASRASLPLVVLEAEKASTDELKAALARATLLLIDLQHPNVAKTVAEKFGPVVAASETPYVAIGEAEALGQQTAAPLEPLRRLRALDPAWASRTAEYFRFGGKANTAALVALLSSREASPQAVLASVPAAVVLPAEGFFHPGWERLETDLRAVLSRVQQPNRPTVAIAVNRLALTSDDTAWLEALIAELEARGLACYAFFGARNNPQLFTQSTSLDAENGGLPAVDLVINAALVLRSNERRAELDKLGVPVLQTLPGLTISEQEWRASSEGLPLADVSFYLAASELAGMVDPVLISARNPTTGALDPLPAQIQAVAEKAAALCRLRRTPRAERRTVIVVYNYPQGENNFGASFLNVPKSLVNVLGAMKSGGYAVEVPTADAVIARTRDALTGFYDRDALARLVASGSAEFLPLDDYARWFASLPKETQDRIVAYWGEPQAGAVEVNGRLGFAIPAVRLGSVAVVPQPPRYELAYDAGAEVRKKRIGHRSSVPLSHAYLATYLWMREQWKADAVVHLGTHGTVEFAPGKERALATTDDPLLALGSLPNVYPYIMDNLGEATTAKRRGRAVMLSHLPPLATPAGFRPGLHEMHNLMHDWETATGPVKDALEKRLVEAFREHHLDRDLGWTSERIAAEFPAFMEVLHPFLDDVAQAAQPQGLAALGEVPSEERRFGMVLQILRKPLIEELGEDIDEVFLLDYEKVRDSRPGRWLRLALRDPQAASTLDLRRIDELDSSKHTSVPNRAAARPLDPAKLLALAQRAQALYATLGENQELVRLLDALDGKHVPAAYGGDPVRNPESLPTGRNIYGFDPARVPTQQAWELGRTVFDEWLKKYREEHDGRFPEKIAFSLWAGETMRHQGVMEAQVFYALGARPQWDEGGRVVGVELLSAEELQRPRLDVVLSVTGSYRDQFPAVMQWVDAAVNRTAALSEADNRVAASVERLRKQLESEGIAADRAARLATRRVFSNEPGVYGTGVSDYVNASDLWEQQTRSGGDAEMAKLFLDRMGFPVGEEAGSADAAGLFARHAAGVDCVLASRSSHTFGVLTSDDPFAYIGAFSLAARSLGGKAPRLYVENLRDESEVIIDPADQAIAKEMQSRYLHPQWIKSQQGEGYSGALQVLKTTQFLWGWQVTAPETVRQDQWQSLFDVYLRDQYQLGTQQWLEETNPAALAQMLERMVDAVRLGYWKPDAQTETELLARFDRAMEQSPLRDRNAAVLAFAENRRTRLVDLKPDASATPENSVAAESPPAAAMAANPSSASSPAPPAKPTAASASPQNAAESGFVQGVKMEPEPEPTAPAAPPVVLPGWWETWGVRLGLLAMVFGLVLAGAWRQGGRFR